MTSSLFKFSSPYTEKTKNAIPVILLREKSFSLWLKKQSAQVKGLCNESNFKGQAEKALIIRNSKGAIESIAVGINTPCQIYDTSHAVLALRGIKNAANFSYVLAGDVLKRQELENAYIGWGLACYDFDLYKSKKTQHPSLTWSKSADKKRILSMVQSIHFLRNIVNAPANILGPDELESAARYIAKISKAKTSVIHDKDLLKKNFPLIHLVGNGSDRRPRLIDITWGNPKNKSITLVGKGVCFDTGGLNIKPSSSMALMKKDMGGAAHVLALGHLIMSNKLPIHLRILIPAVENSINGSAFRPGDVIKSRKGMTIENTNTDAEGRLILADALTYACEKKTDLIIDYATLTGSARVALGPDIPPFFSNNDNVAEEIKSTGKDVGDPVWPMPLWRPYRKIIDSPIADMINSAGVPGDLIYSAVFLERFLTGTSDWVHIDTFSWEQFGRPGRPKGAADCGLRAIYSYLEKRYAKKR